MFYRFVPKIFWQIYMAPTGPPPIKTWPPTNKNPRNYKIRAFLGNWKMDDFASPIPDRSKPQCLIWYEILSENKKFSVKRHYLSKHSTSNWKKHFHSTANNKNNLETQELKLKQQQISLKCLMTENSSLTIN